MCSIEDARIAGICAAIEELAGRASAPDGGTADSARPAAGDVAGLLAAIWAMIADVDPELARRLPGYLAAAERTPGRPPAS